MNDGDDSLENVRTTIVFRQAKEGDLRARNELVRRLMPKIERFVAKECGPAVRERFTQPDLIQQAVLKTLEYLPTIDGPRYVLESFVYRVAKNVVTSAGRLIPLLEKLDQREPMAADASVVLEPPARDQTTPSMAAARNEELALARAAMALLEPAHQEAFLRIRVFKQAREDVEAATGEGYDAVKQRAYRAYSSLLGFVNKIRSGQLAVELGEGDEERGEADGASI